MPETEKKPAKPAKDGRWSVRATNQSTGEQWAIDDTRAVCERDVAAKLAEWGETATVLVEWAEAA